MYVCTVCMYTHTYVRMYIHTHIQYICTYVHTYTHMYVCTYCALKVFHNEDFLWRTNMRTHTYCTTKQQEHPLARTCSAILPLRSRKTHVSLAAIDARFTLLPKVSFRANRALRRGGGRTRRWHQSMYLLVLERKTHGRQPHLALLPSEAVYHVSYAQGLTNTYI